MWIIRTVGAECGEEGLDVVFVRGVASLWAPMGRVGEALLVVDEKEGGV